MNNSPHWKQCTHTYTRGRIVAVFASLTAGSVLRWVASYSTGICVDSRSLWSWNKLTVKCVV